MAAFAAGVREVLLHIYDLHSSNSWLGRVGLGFYHSGVEIGGKEVNSLGGTLPVIFGCGCLLPSGLHYGKHNYTFSNEGVIQHTPKAVVSENCTFKCTQVVGEFSGSIGDIRGIIRDLREGSFKPGTYNVTRRNCNHFSDELCQALVGQGIPPWVNRVASAASWAGFGPEAQNAAAVEGKGGSGSQAMGAGSKDTGAGAGGRGTKAETRPKLTDKQRELLVKMRKGKG